MDVPYCVGKIRAAELDRFRSARDPSFGSGSWFKSGIYNFFKLVYALCTALSTGNFVQPARLVPTMLQRKTILFVQSFVFGFVSEIFSVF